MILPRIAAMVFTAMAVLVAGPTQALEPDDLPEPTDACAAPAALGHLAVGLPRTRAALIAGRPLRIVTLGSSSTAGAGASAARFSYPSRLAVELAERDPLATIEIINRGQNGEDAWENLARLDRDVLPLHPDLVIWQFGTNAALHDVDYDDFDRVVQEGLDRLHAAGIEVLLMDLQFAPRVVEVSGHQRMLEEFEAIGARNHVPVFHRYAVMKHWADAMRGDYVTMISSDGLHLTDKSYGCLAARLADAIVERDPPSGVAPSPATRSAVERGR